MIISIHFELTSSANRRKIVSQEINEDISVIKIRTSSWPRIELFVFLGRETEEPIFTKWAI